MSHFDDRHLQLRTLANLLLGGTFYQSFTRLRGRGTTTISEVLESISKHATATEDDAVQVFASDLLNIGTVLKRLKEEGQMEAAQELERSIQDPTFTPTFEEFRDADLRTVTILVPSFQQTLAMVRFIRASKSEYLKLVSENKLPKDAPHLQLVHSLLEAFPSLQKYAEDRAHHGQPIGAELDWSYDDVASRITFANQEQPDAVTLNPRFALLEGRDGLVYKCLNIALFVVGDRREALAPFAPDQHERLSTWECRLPQRVLDGLQCQRNPAEPHQMVINFYPEADHEAWRNRPGYFVSNDLNHGYGVSICHHTRHDPAANDRQVEARTGKVLSDIGTNDQICFAAQLEA